MRQIDWPLVFFRRIGVCGAHFPMMSLVLERRSLLSVQQCRRVNEVVRMDVFCVLRACCVIMSRMIDR